MLVLNIETAFGNLNSSTLLTILKMIPIIWIIVIILEPLLVGCLSENLVKKFTKPSDSFYIKILFNILFCVTGMSLCMTIIGTWIGEGFSWEPFLTFSSH